MSEGETVLEPTARVGLAGERRRGRQVGQVGLPQPFDQRPVPIRDLRTSRLRLVLDGAPDDVVAERQDRPQRLSRWKAHRDQAADRLFD